jgi:hypothetical protein
MRISRKHLFRGFGLLVIVGAVFAAWWWYDDVFPAPPNHVGVIEYFHGNQRDGFTLVLRERPVSTWVTAATSDEQRWSAKASGTIYVHMAETTKLRRHSGEGPMIGHTVKVWTDGSVLRTFPGQVYALKIEYGPGP